MLTVYWTHFAEKKLDDVYAYYSRKAGVNIATKLVVSIIDKSISLEKHLILARLNHFYKNEKSISDI